MVEVELDLIVIILEKEYFTFNELQERWSVSRSEIDNLVLTAQIVPSFFAQDKSGWAIRYGLNQTQHFSRSQQYVEIEDGNLWGIPRIFLFLREPVRTGLTSYEFKLGCTDPVADKNPDNFWVSWYKFHNAICSNSDQVIFLSEQVLAFEADHIKKNEEKITLQKELEELRAANARFRGSLQKSKESPDSNLGLNTFTLSSIRDFDVPDGPQIIDKEVSGKSETSYLGIIGALCDLYWKSAYPNRPKFIQDKIKSALLDKYSGTTGISDRNLREKLPRAIKLIQKD